jgi:hypothetical protein
MKRHILFGLGTIAVLCALTALACDLEPDPENSPSPLEPGLYTGNGVLVPDVSGLTAALDWIAGNGTADAGYTIVLDASETSMAPRELKSDGKLTITLQGYGAAQAVNLAEPGTLFRVSNQGERI